MKTQKCKVRETEIQNWALRNSLFKFYVEEQEPTRDWKESTSYLYCRLETRRECLYRSPDNRWEWKSWLKTQHSKMKITASRSHHFMEDKWGKMGTVTDLIFWALKSLQPWNQKMLAPWKKNYDKLRQCIKKQRHHFADKSLYSQSCGFSRSHVQMWELDHKEGSGPKNWCFQTVVLEKTLQSPMDI